MLKILFINTVFIMLSYRDLKAIQEGNRRNEDVMALLREVRRLRDLVAECYGLIGYMSWKGHAPDEIQKSRELFDKLHAEPSVLEYTVMRKKREDMEYRRSVAQGKIDVRTREAGE